MSGGCGCGGSKQAARPATQTQQRRQSGSTTPPRPPVEFTDSGFTWSGPVRPAEPSK